MRAAGVLARRAATLAIVFTASALGARALVVRLVPPPPPPALPNPAAFNYTAAAQRFSGNLSSRAQGIMDFAADTEVLVLLRKADLVGCEDLGRQLRELKRAYGPRRVIHVFTDSVGPVEMYLHRERIGRVRVRALDPSAVMDEGRAIATPAALRVRRDGRVLEAVSHVRRAPNVRLQSFAQELSLSAPAQPAGADRGASAEIR